MLCERCFRRVAQLFSHTLVLELAPVYFGPQTPDDRGAAVTIRAGRLPLSGRSAPAYFGPQTPDDQGGRDFCTTAQKTGRYQNRPLPSGRVDSRCPASAPAYFGPQTPDGARPGQVGNGRFWAVVHDHPKREALRTGV